MVIDSIGKRLWTMRLKSGDVLLGTPGGLRELADARQLTRLSSEGAITVIQEITSELAFCRLQLYTMLEAAGVMFSNGLRPLDVNVSRLLRVAVEGRRLVILKHSGSSRPSPPNVPSRVALGGAPVAVGFRRAAPGAGGFCSAKPLTAGPAISRAAKSPLPLVQRAERQVTAMPIESPATYRALTPLLENRSLEFEDRRDNTDLQHVAECQSCGESRQIVRSVGVGAAGGAKLLADGTLLRRLSYPTLAELRKSLLATPSAAGCKETLKFRVSAS